MMNQASYDTSVSDELALNYHLMHPCGDSAPGDPNAAFYLDGRACLKIRDFGSLV
jgi:hypothetical protein